MSNYTLFHREKCHIIHKRYITNFAEERHQWKQILVNGGLGIVIVILSFTRWTRDRAVTLGIGGWFLALALSLVFEKALLFTILLGEPVGVAAIVAGALQIAAFAKGETRGIGRILKSIMLILFGIALMYTPVMVWRG